MADPSLSFYLNMFLFCFFPQDAQVTMECVIAQKFHRSIMGPKGSRIQQITRDHNVQIKFPEREDPQGKGTIRAKALKWSR